MSKNADEFESLSPNLVVADVNRSVDFYTRNVHSSLDDLALQVVEMSQLRVKWVPGIQRRHRVRQKYTLPIIFKLG